MSDAYTSKMALQLTDEQAAFVLHAGGKFGTTKSVIVRAALRLAEANPDAFAQAVADEADTTRNRVVERAAYGGRARAARTRQVLREQ